MGWREREAYNYYTNDLPSQWFSDYGIKLSLVRKVVRERLEREPTIKNK